MRLQFTMREVAARLVKLKNKLLERVCALKPRYRVGHDRRKARLQFALFWR